VGLEVRRDKVEARGGGTGTVAKEEKWWAGWEKRMAAAGIRPVNER